MLVTGRYQRLAEYMLTGIDVRLGNVVTAIDYAGVVDGKAGVQSREAAGWAAGGRRQGVRSPLSSSPSPSPCSLWQPLAP